MKKVVMLLADGCEEVEALTVVDCLRRAGIELTMAGIQEREWVTGSHRITFRTEADFRPGKFKDYDGVILPGGMPGSRNLAEKDGVRELVRDFARNGKLVGAICAAPAILGASGVLEGKKATCYPGFEQECKGAEMTGESVTVDGNVITGKGMGVAIDFSLAIVSYLSDSHTATKLASELMCHPGKCD